MGVDITAFGELLSVKRGDQHYMVGSLGSIYLPTSLYGIEDFHDTLKLLFYFKVGELDHAASVSYKCSFLHDIVSSSKSPKIDSSTACKKEAPASIRIPVQEQW